MISRRNICSGLAIGGLGLTGKPLLAVELSTIERRLAALEYRHGGRLGVAIIDTQLGRLVSRRGDERFPLCSVWKLPATAFVLARVDRGQERLDRRITFGKAELVDYSPVTEKYVGTGMTLGKICEAAITLSDNTAQNLLLDSFGGPAALTGYLRSIGDPVGRSDRREPELNKLKPGDERDTSSPKAIAQLMRNLLTDDALSSTSRGRLASWLAATTTGKNRLRASTPVGWSAGDKTGTGPRNATNDVAILYPPGRAPIIVAALYIDSPSSLLIRESVLADVGRLAVTI